MRGLPLPPVELETLRLNGNHFKITECSRDGKFRVNASRHDHHPLGYRITCNIPSLKMTTLDTEPFGKPTLLLGSTSLSDVTGTAAFVSTGLLDSVFEGSGNDGEGEDAFSAQNPPCVAHLDVAGSPSEDQPSEFMSNGLLDGPTQTTSMVNLS